MISVTRRRIRIRTRTHYSVHDGDNGRGDAEITTETDADLTRHTPFYTGGVFSHSIASRRDELHVCTRIAHVLRDTPLTHTHMYVNRISSATVSPARR